MSARVEVERDEMAARLVTLSQRLQTETFKAVEDDILTVTEGRRIIRAAKALYDAQLPLSRPFVLEDAA